MCLAVSQVEATDFLYHHGIGVAHSSLFQVEDVPAPTEVCLLCEEFGVECECAVSHPVEVEELIVHCQDLAEVGFP